MIVLICVIWLGFSGLLWIYGPTPEFYVAPFCITMVQTDPDGL